MRKNIFTIILALVASVGPLFAYDAEIDGLYYNLNTAEQTASVTYKSYSGGKNNEGWNITEANIPSSIKYNGQTYSVTEIGYGAFQDCKNLTTVTIPNSVTSIYKRAFLGCTGLTSITIGKSVTSIGESAFLGCTGLTSVTIPNSVTWIGEGPFAGCTGLTSITVAADNANYCDIDGTLFNKDKTTIIQYLASKQQGEYIIPNSVTVIGGYAFYGCSGLTSVTIPNSVTVIGGYAFYGCSGLTSITIPNSVTGIDNYAFYECTGLTSIYIDADAIVRADYGNELYGLKKYFDRKQIKEVIIGNSVTEIGQYAFTDFSYMTSLIIGNSVTTIGSMSFYRCSDLSNVTLGSAVTSISEHIFDSCGKLTSITISRSLTSIDAYAFINCNVSEIHFMGTMEDWCQKTWSPALISSSYTLYINDEVIRDIVIPNSITSISDYAFKNCSGICSVTIAATVQKMGEGAFSGCSYIKTINWNAYNCKSAESYKKAPFYDTRKNVQYFNFGSDVEHIPAYLCDEMTNLRSITLPESLQSIGKSAFYGCTGLTSMAVPNNVTSIGEMAFKGCSNIKLLSLGENVETYGDNAFTGCSGLKSIYNYRKKPAKLGAGAFNDVDYFNCTLYVFAESVDMYKSTGSDWKDFYFVSPIEAKETTTETVQITPSSNTADMVWPKVEGAASYELIICDKDGDKICSLIFNANGQLISIAFHAPSKNNVPQEMTEQVAGFSFTITGLERASKYAYAINAKDSEGKTIESYTGVFFTEGYEVPTFHIQVACNDEAMGEVIGSGDYKEGTEITLKAVAKEGYRFVQWSDGNKNAQRTVIVSADATYTAEFEVKPDVMTYTLIVNSADNNKGYVTGGGTYEEGEIVTITAVPYEGYRFVQWSDGNKNAQRTVTVTADATYTAEFKKKSSSDPDPEDPNEAIENVDANLVAPQKILHNGVLYILRDGKVYTVQGQEVK